MKRWLLLLPLLLYSFCSSSQSWNGLYRENPKKVLYFKDGRLRFKGEYDAKNKRTGIWTECEKERDGSYYCQKGKYIEEFKQGTWEVMDSTGRVLFTENYVNNYPVYPEGINIIYYKNGKIKEKGRMKNNQKDSTWTTYYFSGKIESEKAYIDGQICGTQCSYYENGNPKLTENQLLGCRLIDTTFKLVRTHKDYGTNVWFCNSVETGEQIHFHENGQAKERGWYGLLDSFPKTSRLKFNVSLSKVGPDTTDRPYWFENIKSLYYPVATRIGNWTTFYENGQQESTGIYLPQPFYVGRIDTAQIEDIENEALVECVVKSESIIFLKDKTWQYFSERGEMTREEYYTNGRLISVKQIR